MYIEKKPIKRSKIRNILGKKYYIYRRYLQWCITGKKFAKNLSSKKLECKIFQHNTPLLRKLKNVEMWMQHNKITNLKLAVEKINGILIRPGETFSYWKLIGKPTYKKGYLDGMVLCPDGTFKPGVGGGLCQLSNLIYWMTLHTPLTVIERYRHSHDVFPDVNRTQPFGSGATCVYNYFDLQIYNQTKDTYQLNVHLTDSDLVGEWRSTTPSLYRYEIYERDHSMTPSYWGGYIRNNKIYRKVYNLQDELIDDQFIAENHAIMVYTPFIESKME